MAFSLKLHEHSALVEIPGACYILMVDELQPAHVTPLADAAVRDEIETTLKAQERNRLQKKWMDRIKKKAYVRLF